MKTAYLKLLLLAILFFGFNKKSEACHAIALVNFTQQQYTPGTGLFINAASDSPTCGCGAYWLDVEFRCDQDVMDGSGLSAGVWDSSACFPYFQSDTMLKTSCVVQNYPGVTISENLLCPGKTYQYRLRENHNGAVGPWTPIMYFTMPGTPVPMTPGHIDITAAPNPFCISTQLGWTITPGTGCGVPSCNPDTSFQWTALNGEPIIVGQNFSCDTCPYPIASPSIPTTYALTISIGDTNACGEGIYTQTPVTVIPLPWPQAGSITETVDCNTGMISMTLAGYSGDLQWQTSSNGGPWSNIPGEITDTYMTSSAPPGTCFRVEISTPCDAVYSNVVCPSASGNLVADFSVSANCENDQVVFTDLSSSSGSGITSWSWDFGDGSPVEVSQNASHQFVGNGPFNVTLDVTNAAGCTNSVTYPVQLNAKPVADFTIADVCQGTSSDFIDNSTISSGSITSWSWDFGDGSALNSTQNPSYTYAQEDIYTVRLIVTSDQGCSDTIQLPTTVFFQPNAGFTNTTVCGDDDLTAFTNTSNYNAGNITSWSWDFGDGTNSAVQDPVHGYANTGSYNVTLIASTQDGCTDQVTQTVNVLAKPVADFNSDITEGCEPVCVNFTDNSTIQGANLTSWEWDLGDGNSSNAQNPTNCYNHSGVAGASNYGVTLIVTADNGCSDTMTNNNMIAVHQNPVANFMPNPGSANEYNSTIDFDNYSTGADTYAWNFGDGNTSTQFEPDNYYADTGNYMVELIVYTNYGCSDTVYMPVEITPLPSCNAPNAFSPNGDGVNDVFLPVLRDHEKSDYTLLIFDRGGQLVFQTKDRNQGWDGSVEGNEAKTDIFVWKIIVNHPRLNKKEEYVGHVTVLR